jgi:hypothetical protein
LFLSLGCCFLQLSGAAALFHRAACSHSFSTDIIYSGFRVQFWSSCTRAYLLSPFGVPYGLNWAPSFSFSGVKVVLSLALVCCYQSPQIGCVLLLSTLPIISISFGDHWRFFGRVFSIVVLVAIWTASISPTTSHRRFALRALSFA